MDGVINIYKEKGFTSHDVVAKLRGILKQKKIGHTGTLDPDAEGVLPVCLGNGTKLCDLLTDKDKTYIAVLKLGITTDTQDMTGTILTEKSVFWKEEQIRETIASFVGEYDQIPPMYSALKVNGKKLYELAREGKEIERKSRRVQIYHIDILEMDDLNHEVRMEVSCSKGTYIRTLCYDIGEALLTGGTMKSLLRTKVERFSLSESKRLSEVKKAVKDGTIASLLIPVADMFPQYADFYVKDEKDRFLYNGNMLSMEDGNLEHSENLKKFSEIVRIYDSKRVFKGLYAITEDKKSLKPYKMFL
ncbi:MAG: tRNA pseudouridine(55) synthase TruB [Acetivibrio sp.]